jgi:type II secretory pathway predicted ATPase ExeA
MYDQFFGLTRRPFGATPDPTLYFPAVGHKTAIHRLRASVHDGDGLSVLVGPPGIGKTLACRMLLDEAPETQSVVLLANMHMATVQSMLQAVLYDLSIAFDAMDEQELRLRLIDELTDRFSHGGQTLLLVDEAQNLSLDQLEELRLLTNLEGREEKAVQIVLFGQNSLLEMLEGDALGGIRQRISTLARLEPLEEQETIDYIRFRIQAAGTIADSIFTANALCDICEHSGGIPRRINQLCHLSMTIAFENESGTVDSPYVEQAVDQLLWPRDASVVEPQLAAEANRAAELSRAVAEPVPSHASMFASTPTVVEVGANLHDDAELRFVPPSRDVSSDRGWTPPVVKTQQPPAAPKEDLRSQSRLHRLSLR